MKRLELELDVWQDFSSAQWPSLPSWGVVWSQVAQAEALRVGPELAPFPLSVCFLFFLIQDPFPKGEECCNKWGPCSFCQLQTKDNAVSDVLHMQVPAVVSITLLTCSTGANLCSSHLIIAPSLWGPHPVVESYHRAGRIWMNPQGRLRVSCGGVATLKDRSCFWCVAWVSASKYYFYWYS